MYILLDALDESPPCGQRRKVLKAVANMLKWPLPGFHVLVTSRDELDIRKYLSLADDQEVTQALAQTLSQTAFTLEDTATRGGSLMIFREF